VKRRFISSLTALAVVGSFMVGPPGSARANCDEYTIAIDYHSRKGNVAFAVELGKLAQAERCEVIRNRMAPAPHVERRMIAD
jgi:hypothetical protein